MSIIRTYSPGLLVQCHDQRQLAEQMVAEWLENYMSKGSTDSKDRASKIAHWFSDYTYFRSHGVPVGFNQVRELGLNVKLLEVDPRLQDAFLSVHHAVMHTFAGTGATKIIENHNGAAFIRAIVTGIIQAQQGPTQPANPSGNFPSNLPRQQHRALDRKNKKRR
jgi:hypothetical protein